MRCAYADENTWLYRDIFPELGNIPALDIALNGHAAFRVQAEKDWGGNGFVVYPGENGPVNSVRSRAQMYDVRTARC